MKTRIVGACFAALSLVAAAGCSDDSPPSRATVTNQLVKSAKDSGVDVDKDCVSKVVAKFSDDDFKVLQDSAGKEDINTDALSDEGQARLVDLFNCSGGTEGGSVPSEGDLTTTQAAILDQITSTFTAQGLKVDEDCLKELVAKLDSAAIASQDAEVLTKLGTEAAACLQP